jgi:hypothetical protein
MLPICNERGGNFAGGLFFFWRMCTVTADKAPGGVVEMGTLAAALPLFHVIDQSRARIVARHSQNEAAIGTGNSLGRHSFRPPHYGTERGDTGI